MSSNADSDRGWLKPSTSGGSQSSLALPAWWRVCFVHGDQTKNYRKLYGRKSEVRSLNLVTSPASLRGSETDQDSM